MTRFQTLWAEQLRAGALQIADQAEKIVGELDMNRQLSVTIRLSPGNGQMEAPTIEIYREILSKPMLDVLTGRNEGVKQDVNA